MKAKDIMTPDPAYCTPNASLQQVAHLMVEYDCGCIPVVESQANLRPVGVITDRDIAQRTVAQGKNPLAMTADEVSSSPVISATLDTTVEDCCRLMEEHQIRRLLVVDDKGGCRGIIAQADIALQASKSQTSKLVREVSQPAENGGRMATAM